MYFPYNGCIFLYALSAVDHTTLSQALRTLQCYPELSVLFIPVWPLSICFMFWQTVLINNA